MFIIDETREHEEDVVGSVAIINCDLFALLEWSHGVRVVGVVLRVVISAHLAVREVAAVPPTPERAHQSVRCIEDVKETARAGSVRTTSPRRRGRI